MTSPVTLAQMEQELWQIDAAFRTALRLLREDTPVDLAGMDDKVREFCRMVEKSPPDARGQLAEDVENLQTLLQEIDFVMRESYARAQAAIGGKSAHE